ncbi:MAG: tetratricopeptide repeat protein [Pseudomonadota bacterium]
MKDNITGAGSGLIKFSMALFMMLCLFVFNPAHGHGAQVKSIVLDQDSPLVRIVVSEKVASKVIRVDGKEVLIALRNVSADPGVRPKVTLGGPVREIAVEPVGQGDLAIVITGTHAFEIVEPVWDKSGLSLEVRLGKTGKTMPPATTDKPKSPSKPPPKVAKGKPAESSRAAGKPESQSPGPKPEAQAPEAQQIKNYVPPVREKSIYAGDISDLILKSDLSGCTLPALAPVPGNMKNGQWEQAFEILDAAAKAKKGDCQEQVLFLRAYAFYKGLLKGDILDLLQASGFFQEAMVSYPESRLIPFSLAAMGLIQLKLKNPAAAEGFFTMVKDDYLDYSGMAEILYQLGLIYQAKGYGDKAQDYFRTVFETYPENAYTVDAGIGYGRTLLAQLHYIDAVSILSSLIRTNPEKVYDSPDLLLSMGDADLKLGRSASARENLMRALNLFPDIPGKDTIMSSIGDTYAMEKNSDRAMGIYRYVMATYPGTEGFVSSAVGLARHLTDRAEREALYTMVKKDYPEHPLASVAMMRLAEIYEGAGEYSRCIEEIETMLTAHPRGLRYEAVKLMQRAYEALFKQQLKAGQYPAVLNRYEKQQSLLDRMESRELFLTEGLAYAEARLYEQSFNQLIQAYKLFNQSSRPPELMVTLGVAMDETGRKDDALNVFKGFVKRFPNHGETPVVFFRMGSIYAEKSDTAKALSYLSQAYQATRDNLLKGKTLLKEAEVYRQQKQWDKVSAMLAKAVNDFASASGKNYDMITVAYKGLGESYVEQELYLDAAAAFSMAIKFSDGGQTAADIGFMLGDAYQKGNELKKARETFDKIANGDDSIWARMARERLTTLDLAEKVKNS